MLFPLYKLGNLGLRMMNNLFTVIRIAKMVPGPQKALKILVEQGKELYPGIATQSPSS